MNSDEAGNPQVVIVDPALTGDVGHMLGQARALSAAFNAAGAETTVSTNTKFDKLTEFDVGRVDRRFNTTPYHMPSNDTILARIENANATEPRLTAEFKSFFGSYTGKRAIFVFPTVNYIVLRSLSAALESFRQNWPAGWTIHVLLYLECGVTLNGDETFTLTDTLLAALVKPSIVSLLLNPNVKLSGVSKEMSKLYSYLAGKHIGHVAAYHQLDGLRDGIQVANGQSRALLYGGQASTNKGFQRLAALAELVVPKFPNTQFLVQLHHLTKAPQQEVAERVRSVAAKHANLRIIEGSMTNAEIATQLNSCSVIVIGYLRQAYAGKTSGFLWDAVRVGARVVTPSNTWMAREAAYFGTPVVPYDGETPEAVALAIGKALQITGDEPARLAAAEKFVSECGPPRLAEFVLGRPAKPHRTRVEPSKVEVRPAQQQPVAKLVFAEDIARVSTDPSRWLLEP